MKLLAILLLSSVIGSATASEKALAAHKKVSFTEFLELARENDPNLSSIMADKKRSKFLVDLGLPARELFLRASSEYGVSVQDNQSTNRNSAELSKNFIETGTSISVAYENNDLADRTEEVEQIRLEQALWRNLFGKYTRLQKEALKKEAKSLTMQVVDAYEGYLANLGELYLDYAQAWHNVDLAKRILKETINLKNNVAKMKQNNIASQTDLKRARLQVALRKEDLVNLESGLETLRARLITSANLPKTMVVPDLESFTAMLPKLRTEGIEYEDLRASKIAKLDLDAASKRVVLADGLNDPSLNLVAGYNIDESTRFGTAVNREERIIGLQFEVPFGNSKNDARLEEASLNKLKSEISARGIRRNSMQEFQVLRVRLKNAKQVLEINQEKVELAQQVYSGDLKRYQYGNLSLDRFIEAKNDYSLARYQLFASSAAYYKLALRWLDLSDRLIEKL